MAVSVSQRGFLRHFYDNDALFINGFRILFTLLPSVERRLRAFLQRPVHRRRYNVFQESDALVLRLEPFIRGYEMVFGEEMDMVIQDTLRDVGVPMETSALVFMYLRNNERQIIGGQSSVSQNYDRISEFELMSYLERMSDAGYTGFIVSDIVVEFHFPLAQLLPLLVRGGCKLRSNLLVPLEKSHKEAISLDERFPPLCDYDVNYTASDKLALYYVMHFPTSCHHLRGIYFYGWQDHWRQPLCGWMSLVYSLACFRYRRVRYLLQHEDDPVRKETYQSVYERERQRLVGYQFDVDSLYLDGLRLGNQVVFDHCEDRPDNIWEQSNPHEPVSIATLASYVRSQYPDANFSVYDATTRCVFRQPRTQSSDFHPHIMSDPMPPFHTENNPLTIETIRDFFDTQVSLFYDFEQAHFYPIFSLKQFFMTWPKSVVQDPTIEVTPCDEIVSSPSPMDVTTMEDQRTHVDRTTVTTSTRISSFIRGLVDESVYSDVVQAEEDECDMVSGELISTSHLENCISEPTLSDTMSFETDGTLTESRYPVLGGDVPFSVIEQEPSPTVDTPWVVPAGVGKGNCMRCRHNICNRESHKATYDTLQQRHGPQWPFPFPPQRPYYDAGCLPCRYGFCRKAEHFHREATLPIQWVRSSRIESNDEVNSHEGGPQRPQRQPRPSYCYPCPGCDFRLTSSSVRRHHCRVIQCPHCYIVFHDVSEYERHFTASVSDPVYEFTCGTCQKQCFNRECYLKHRQLCAQRIETTCVYCRESIGPTQKHVCKPYFCFSCQQKVQDPVRTDPLTERMVRGLHKCYMNRPKQKFTGYAGLVMDLHSMRVFTFDFESRLEKVPGLSYPFDVDNAQTNSVLNPVYRHTVNCCSFMEVNVSRIVTHTIPPDRADQILQGAKPVVMTAYRRHVDISQDQVGVVSLQSCFDLYAFWKSVVEYSTSRENYWYAHNMKAYDGRLLYDYLLSRNVYPIRMFWMGQKVMHLEYYGQKGNRIIFRDSACHIATSLSKLPAMFGLDVSIVKKGLFPYRLNQQRFKDYRGPFPSFDLFDTSCMSEKAFQDFRQWYCAMQYKSQEFHDRFLQPLGCDADGLTGWDHGDSRHIIDREWEKCHYDERHFESTGIYDLNTEMIRYCENDVFVLSESLMKYTEVCCSFVFRSPLKSVTVPQFTYQMYLQLYLPVKKICYLDINESRFARRALRGGNTNVRRLYYEPPQGEPQSGYGARYIDIQSLYPAVQFSDPMPVGRPFVRYFTSIDKKRTFQPQPRETELRHFFGFIECDIAIPNVEEASLPFHPVLSLRGKIRQHLTLLSHYHPLERVVITSVECQAALDQGYQVTHVYRMDEYQQSTTLFREFVSTWLKLKLLNSPIPSVYTKHLYVNALNRRYQFKPALRGSDFPDQPNIAMRGLAKLMLNSLWGKFGQRSDMVSKEILKHGSDVFKLNAQIQQGWVRQKKREFIRQSGGMCSPFQIADVVNYLKRENKNVAVAAFVTAHARLRLWKAMEQCDDKVLYHDTDSIVYEVRSNQRLVEEGLFLGDWESETGDTLIHQFVSLAPKTYAYRYTPDHNGPTREVVKGKGCSLNRENSTWIHFDSYAYLLCATFLRSPDPRVVAWFQSSVVAFPKLHRIAVQLFARMEEALSVPAHQCPLLQKQWECQADSFLAESMLDSSRPPSLPEQYRQSFETDWDNVVQLYILRHLAIPSRMLLFKRLTDIGETVTFLLKKSFKFDYVKGEIDVATLTTYPFGRYQYMHCRFDYLAKMVVFHKNHLVSLCSLYPTLSLKELLITGVGQLEYSPIRTGTDPDHPYEEPSMPTEMTGLPTTEPTPQSRLFFVDSESRYLTEGMERYLGERETLSLPERSQLCSLSDAWCSTPSSSLVVSDDLLEEL